MANRFFVVPIATTDDGGRYPKYSDEGGITGFSGNTMDFSADKWSDLPWYPNEMYVLRFYGDTSTLDTIEGYDDAWSENDASESEIADYLNDKFGESRSYSEWLNHFGVGV